MHHLRSNLKSGITVALVSMPLSLSLAVASNVAPITGILTAVWAGLFAAIFGGSKFNIVGPTGALSGVIAVFILTHGPGLLPLLTVLVGGIIFVSYLLKLERYLVLVPASVIHGFTLGVALIIALGQLNFAFGLTGLPRHEHFTANLREIFLHLSDFSFPAFAFFLAFFLALLFFRKFSPKLPGAIILAPFGILLGYLGSRGMVPIRLQTLGDIYGDMQFAFFQPFQVAFSYSLIEPAIIIALIAILETMLSARIADGMTRTHHDERKEMFGLSLANLGSGLFGGMPATAALARTALNINTGATHRTSAGINAVAVAVISIFFLGTFTYIPLAVIAAILVFVAVGMVESKHLQKLFRYDRAGFSIALFVAALTLFVDPMIGILSGTAIALLLFVNRISRGSFDMKINSFREGIVGWVSGERLKDFDSPTGEVLLYSFRGKLCYINARAHLSRFESDLQEYAIVILRLREVHFIDMDGVEALDEIIATIRKRGQRVLLTSLNTEVARLLEQASESYRRLREDGLVFEKAAQALNYIGIPLDGKGVGVFAQRQAPQDVPRKPHPES